PIQFDYGCFTHLGDNFYANFNLTVLDTCPITIGKNVMCGPNVSLITPLHPLMYEQRNPRKQADGEVDDIEYGAPITIGDNCWLASNVTVCPGVTIGNGCVIGAGAVVTKDVPDNSLVVGVPGKVIRKITEKDRLKDFPY
nr:sugar O-acetyltransferase [Lactobacillus amylovorus]